MDCSKLREEIALGPLMLKALNEAYMSEPPRRDSLIARARRQSYVNGIVSIYGLLEESVDQLVLGIAAAYDDIFTRIVDMPTRTQDAHRELSLRALLDTSARGRAVLVDADAFHSLHAQATGVKGPLNAAALTYSTANYRHPLVREMLLRLDIEVGDKLPHARSALESSGLNFASIDSAIADLVERRNEVAHSYHTPQLLDVSTLTAYLDFVSAYIEELYALSFSRVIQLVAAEHLAPLGQVKQVWTGAVGIDMVSGELRTPCRVLLAKDSYCSTVDALSLQINSIDIGTIVEYQGTTLQLGVGLAGQPDSRTLNCTAFVLPDKWAYLI